MSKPVVYTASKTRHAAFWRALRSGDRVAVNSTWIDEAGEGETACFNDLWARCIREASTADALLIYCAPGDVLKGAWIELGAALANDVAIYAVGIEGFTIAKFDRIRHFASIDDALDAICAAALERV